MKILQLNQAGPAWHAWRREGFGASDAPALIGDSPWANSNDVLATKLGLREVKENEAMRRGKMLEPLARAIYVERTGIQVRPCCIVHDEHPWLRASLDGLSVDNDLILEIKCPNNRAHWTALQGRVPDYYRAQLQWQLAAAGLDKLHYWSYSDRDPFEGRDRGALVEVGRDEAFIKRLLDRGQEEWERYLEMKQTLDG